MQKETEIRSLPAPSLQSFLTRASATPNKVSASRRPPSEASSEGPLPWKQDPNKLRGNANHPQEDAYEKSTVNIQHFAQIRTILIPTSSTNTGLGASHLKGLSWKIVSGTPLTTSASLLCHKYARCRHRCLASLYHSQAAD